MNIGTRLRTVAASFSSIALLAASLAAQGAPTLSASSDLQPRAIVLGIQVKGAPNSLVMVAASFQPRLASPIHTPMGNLLISGVDAILPMRTDAFGTAKLRVSLSIPVRPFFFWMQALVDGKLTNALALGAGGGTQAAAVNIATNDKGELTTMTIAATGIKNDAVCVTFKDAKDNVLAPRVCGSIGDNGQLPGGTMTVPIPKDAKTFEVTVGAGKDNKKAYGTLR